MTWLPDASASCRTGWRRRWTCFGSCCPPRATGYASRRPGQFWTSALGVGTALNSTQECRNWSASRHCSGRRSEMGKAHLRRRLDLLTHALAPLPTASPTVNAIVDSAKDEARELAAESAKAFGALAGHYREHAGLSPEEARARAAATP